MSSAISFSDLEVQKNLTLAFRKRLLEQSLSCVVEDSFLKFLSMKEKLEFVRWRKKWYSKVAKEKVEPVFAENLFSSFTRKYF